MKKIEALIASVFLVLFFAAAAIAQEAGQWSFGLRGGASWPTNSWVNLKVTDTDGSTGNGKLRLKRPGPMVSGKLSYAWTDYFSLGLNGEWDTHKYGTKTIGLDCGFDDDHDGQDFGCEKGFKIGGGRLNTFSLMPFVEVRPMKFGDFSPYLNLGAGVNFNSVQWRFVTVGRAADTFALKVGGGFDYFLTKHLAFNTEVGYKRNEGGLRYAGVVNDAGEQEGVYARGRSHASTVSLLVGLRYHFPKPAGGIVQREKIVERERIVEKPVDRIVTKEVIKEVPVEKIVRVPEYITVERIVFSDIAFDYDKSTLTDLGKGRVYLIAQKLKDNKTIKVVVEGHTDFIGTDEYNQALGLRRANAVREELVRLGITVDRMTTASYGESQPLLDMQTDWARAVNRRVEFEVSGDVPKK